MHSIAISRGSAVSVGNVSVWCLIAVVCSHLTGCGKANDGPARFRVSGTVTFDGEPVPFGSVIFNPDGAAGNSGPQGSAEIIAGKFDTRRADGAGSSGGPMEITVIGYRKKNVSEGEDPGMLFTAYTYTKELPRADVVETIEVPQSAALKPSAAKK